MIILFFSTAMACKQFSLVQTLNTRVCGWLSRKLPSSPSSLLSPLCPTKRGITPLEQQYHELVMNDWVPRVVKHRAAIIVLVSPSLFPLHSPSLAIQLVSIHLTSLVYFVTNHLLIQLIFLFRTTASNIFFLLHHHLRFSVKHGFCFPYFYCHIFIYLIQTSLICRVEPCSKPENNI